MKTHVKRTNELPYYTAVLVAHKAGEAWVLGSKAITESERKALEASGAVVLQRHPKCPKLLYVILAEPCEF